MIKERRFHWWWSWNFRREEQWLDSLSKQGLHLSSTREGLWHTFTKDANSRYVYRLDYRPSLRKKGILQEYLDFYLDLGWDHVAQTTGWHYFRKPWVDGETLDLYTDRDSLKEHYRRIQGVIVLVFFINLILCLVNIINIRNLLVQNHGAGTLGVTIPYFSIYAMLFLLIGYGFVTIRRKIGRISLK